MVSDIAVNIKITPLPAIRTSTHNETSLIPGNIDFVIASEKQKNIMDSDIQRIKCTKIIFIIREVQLYLNGIDLLNINEKEVSLKFKNIKIPCPFHMPIPNRDR
jgi:hypothetical protein